MYTLFNFEVAMFVRQKGATYAVPYVRDGTWEAYN